MLNISLLKTFVSVVEEGSLSAAAEKMSISQPAISLHIQSIEEYFGARLFHRRGKGMELTPEGQIVYLKAQEMIKFCENTTRDIFESIEKLKDQIVVGAGPIMTDYLLPHVIAIFKKEYPQIDVVCEPHETEDIIKGVLDHAFDVGMVGFPIENNKLKLEEWANNELVLVVPPGHALAGKKIIRPEEIVGQTFIWRTGVSGIKMFFQERLAAMNVHIDIDSGSEVPSTMSLLSSVQAGLGISLIPRYAAENAIDMGMVVSVEIEGVQLTRKLYIVTHRLRQPAIVREFVKAAKKYSEYVF